MLVRWLKIRWVEALFIRWLVLGSVVTVVLLGIECYRNLGMFPLCMCPSIVGIFVPWKHPRVTILDVIRS